MVVIGYYRKAVCFYANFLLFKADFFFFALYKSLIILIKFAL